MFEHPIVHIEFPAQDLVGAAKFYEDVFGWRAQQMPEMNYATFESQEGFGGGFNPVSAENPVGKVIIYIQADDIEAALATIAAHGGKTIVPKSEIPGIGWFAIFTDPTGNQVGLYKGLQAA